MNILILSDSHGHLGMRDFIRKADVDFVLHCGDLSLYSEMEKPTYFIKGNHEDYNLLEAMTNGTLEFKNLRYIKNGEIISLSKGKEIIKILGFGGNYSPKFYFADKLYHDRRRHFTEKDFNNAIKHKHIDILLTHEVPKGLHKIKLGIYEEDLGNEVINKLIEETKPKFAFSGHYHRYNEMYIGDTRCIGLPRYINGNCILDTDNNILYTESSLDLRSGVTLS